MLKNRTPLNNSMVKERIKGKFFLYGLIILMLLLGNISMLKNYSNKFLIFQIMVLIVLTLWSAKILLNYAQRGKRGFLSFFIVYLLNSVLVWLLTNELKVSLLLLASLWLIVSLKKYQKELVYSNDVHSEIIEPIKKTEPQYFASENSKLFHYKSCPWAKKINKKTLIKFNTKDEAMKRGYKPHHCV
jgi:hypothetical protein